jgi:hypothetical protein
VLFLGGCPGDPVTPEVVFPEDYAATYLEVRNCRRSIDHDVNFVRVLADPAAYEPYMGRTAEFPVGAVVLKVEYVEEADCLADADIERWSVMRKEEPGFGGDEYVDWYFQRVNVRREVISDNEERCTRCHSECGVLPDGYDGTCAIPP